MTIESTTGYAQFQVERRDGCCVLKLVNPRLQNYLLVEELNEELLDLFAREHPHNILVDFGQVETSSTAAINGLVNLRLRLRQFGGRMVLCGLSENVREKLRILNLDGRVFEICPSRDDAFAVLECSQPQA